MLSAPPCSVTMDVGRNSNFHTPCLGSNFGLSRRCVCSHAVLILTSIFLCEGLTFHNAHFIKLVLDSWTAKYVDLVAMGNSYRHPNIGSPARLLHLQDVALIGKIGCCGSRREKQICSQSNFFHMFSLLLLSFYARKICHPHRNVLGRHRHATHVPQHNKLDLPLVNHRNTHARRIRSWSLRYLPDMNVRCIEFYVDK